PATPNDEEDLPLYSSSPAPAAQAAGAPPLHVWRACAHCQRQLASASRNGNEKPMRTDLDHLPAAKQRELERVVQILFEEFDEARVLATQEWKKKGRILKVILYGSYARGGWVDEPHTAKGYKSDFDLLIIVNDKRLTDRIKYWAKLDERLMREYGITGSLKTPVNFIVHTLQEVNDGL